MEEIFQIAGAIIVSFGGSGVILLGLSSWLGKVWASRILEAEKKMFVMEIEEYKNKLEKEISIAKSIIDKSIYVTKLQYDKEFSIYLEIWEEVIECIVMTKNLYPILGNAPSNEGEREKFNKSKWDKFVEKYNKFSNTVDKYSPFYDEELYQGFKELRRLCYKQGNVFQIHEFDERHPIGYGMERRINMSAEQIEEVYNETPKKIDELQNLLQKKIKEYLRSLQAMNE